MVHYIEAEEYGKYLSQFPSTVRAVFPALGFSPVQIGIFLNNNDRLYGDDTVFVVRRDGDVIAYGMRYSGWRIEYLIPSRWSDRYLTIANALEQLVATYLASQSATPLQFRISEDAPSHNAFYAALLPAFGFEMEPRIRMTAEAGDVDLDALPSLPQGIAETTFAAHRLPEFAALHASAFRVYPEYEAGESFFRLKTRYAMDCAEAAQKDDCVKTWIGLEYQGKLVGSCYGTFDNEKMFIEELAVAPDYQGQQLGKYLLLRCMQALQRHYGAAERKFFLDTTRTWNQALRLYYNVGFSRLQLYTNGILRCPHAEDRSQ